MPSTQTREPSSREVRERGVTCLEPKLGRREWNEDGEKEEGERVRGRERERGGERERERGREEEGVRERER